MAAGRGALGFRGCRGDVGEFGSGAKDEMGCGVDVDGVVSTQCVQPCTIAAEGEGGEAEVSVAVVAFRLAGGGEGRCGTAASTVAVRRAEVPELDARVGFGSGEEEVGARAREEGEGCYGDVASPAWDLGSGGSVETWCGFGNGDVGDWS